ncbi:uncharacterized protein LOC144428281 [Styela clava]
MSKLTTSARVVLGVLFICAGATLMPRLGLALVPDTHKELARDFGKYLRVAPFRSFIKCTSVQYMSFIGYTEFICGCLMLSNQLTGVASFILAGVMAMQSYIHYRLKDQTQIIAVPIVLCILLLFVSLTNSRSRKEKSD